MKRINFIVVMVFLLALVIQSFAQPSLNAEAQKQMVLSNLSSMPLSFTENRGQWNEKALFRAEAGGATFFFCKDKVAYIFTRDTDELIDAGVSHAPDMPGKFQKFDHPLYKRESMVLYAQFVGGSKNAEIIGADRLGYNCNYFYGNDPSKWATDVPNYSSITYKDIYQGIDLKYHGDGTGMKYDFIVNPGADISQIKIKYDGINNLGITANGDLEAATSFGPIHENIPEIYQEINGSKARIEGRYILREEGSYGFEIDHYNPNYPLVIDPELVYSTYLGGINWDYGYDVAVDESDCAYIIGTVYRDWRFPLHYELGNPDEIHEHIFVVKFSSSGTSLLYSTMIGGGGGENGYGIAVDDNGMAFLTGFTYSSNFPLVNPYQGNQGEGDIFVAKLSAQGDSLIFSTLIGGYFNDIAKDIAIDDGGNSYITGDTRSPDFPLVNPIQTDQPGWDAFVTKLSPAGDSLVFSTYLGGESEYECGLSIAVGNDGSANVTGYTQSANFPLENPYQTYQSGQEAFISKFSPIGNSLAFSTFLGGDNLEIGYAIAVDSNGAIFVGGETQSANFPLENAYQNNISGLDDAFVSKLSPAGDSLIFSTYLGGSSFDRIMSIAIDNTGRCYATGSTSSNDFPLLNSYEAYHDSQDVFVSMFSTNGDVLIYSTYLGGSRYDLGYAIAIDVSGAAYITGITKSPDFPMVNSYDGIYSEEEDIFVAKFGEQVPPPPIGAIAGVVTDSTTGDPLEGAIISAHQDGTEMTWYDTTDALGEYLFPECQTQSHAVEASLPGYITQTRLNVEVFADETTHVDFALLQEASGCSYLPGDINNNGSANGVDIVFAVNYLTSGFHEHAVDCGSPIGPCPENSPFYAAGDVNGNCAFNGIDITFFVRYLKLQVPNLLYCPDCPPAP